MPEATITIVNIQEPAQGKKMFTAFDSRGEKWQVWPDKVNLYAPGGTYTIEYQSSVFKGTTYNTISKLVSSQGGAAQARPPAPQRGFAGPSPISAPGSLPAYIGHRPPPVDDRGEDIFVCGAINNMLSNPQVNPLVINEEELKGMVLTLRRVWAATKRGQRGRDDMDDSIPI